MSTGRCGMPQEQSLNRDGQNQTRESKSVESKAPEPEEERVEHRKQGFPVVALGASAGGLEALEQLFKLMPADSGMAFVIIQHLEPSTTSSMPEILSRFTQMPVAIAAEGLQVKPNSIYLIPPNKNMGIRNGVLFLEELKQPSEFTLTVDFFFHSLAGEKGPESIGIILSGTGTDGTLGLMAIKAELGTILVQDPTSSRYDGMPLSAVKTGLADFILKPEEMPRKLIQLGQLAASNKVKFETLVAEAGESLQQIFAILLARTGHDFSGYKKATILRRLQRRMSVNQISNIAAYVRFLQEEEKEANELLNDLLISVTSFFRDPEAFESLKTQLKEMIKAKTPGSDLRGWVAGCATGEETYSVTILISEILDEVKMRLQVQVYGTDIDLDALRTARAGLYPADITEEVSPERLQRYFVKEHNGYRIRKEIRDKVVFAPQDFTKDPPFSKMDLICCRNLLIYLESDMQKKLLPLMHYALKPGGMIFLGPSETVSESADLFSLLDRKWKIYQRRDIAVAPERLKFPTTFAPSSTGLFEEPERELAKTKIPELSEKVFLDKYAPTFAVVDEKYRPVYVRGRTGKYLELSSGQPNWSILEMAREGLKMNLSSALFRAAAEKKINIHEGISVKTNGDFQTINLIVAPFEEPGIPPGYLMIVFQETGTTITKTGDTGKESEQTTELEQQLKTVRENLQTTVEELEATNEELKSANEELQSNNEELQSTNEELDTSREELQSLNEELTTMNSELRDKNDQLVQANDDLRNFLDRTDIAIIFLDEELKIRSFTPASCDVFKLRDIDIGRPLGEISSELAYDNVIGDAQEVLHTFQHKKIDVQSKDERWYTMRILPYRTLQNTISGLVLSFLDIDQQKRAVNELGNANMQLQEALEERRKAEREKAYLLKESNERLNDLQTLLDNASVAIWIAREPECLTITGNKYANQLFGVQAGDNISKSAEQSEVALSYKAFRGSIELKPGELPAQVAAATGKPVFPYEIELVFEDGRRINMIIGAVPLLDANGQVRGSVSIGTDITEQKKIENSLRESEGQANALIKYAPTGIYEIDFSGPKFISINEATLNLTGYTREEMFALGPLGILDDEGKKVFTDRIRRQLAGEKLLDTVEYGIRKKDGTLAYIVLNVAFSKVNPHNALVIGHDVTERRQMEDELKASEGKYRNLFTNLTEGFALCQIIIDSNGKPTDYRIQEVNQAWENLTGLSASQVIGKPIKEIIPSLEQYWIDNYGKVALTGEPIRIENYNKFTDRWYEISAYSPRKGYFVSLVQNITKRKKAEEVLQRYTKELENANKELESFSYSVSHDLRAPLRALDGFSKAVIDEYEDKLDEQGKDYLNRVRNASHRMSDLINDLLKLSRLSRAEMHFQKVDLSAVAQSIIKELQKTQPSRKAEIGISPGLIVKGDQALLTIALQNLLGNSWKFTAKCPQARIELGMTQQNGEKVYYVRDNGIGFDMKYRDKLFQPFQRLHSDKGIEGSGIGLATVQRVIRRHEGRIWAESEKGKGTSFYFTLA
jgi:two-component system, chemotaxis family, CheB/CheR fusion protein